MYVNNKYYENTEVIEIRNNVDNLISFLNKKDKRKLLTLIRANKFVSEKDNRWFAERHYPVKNFIDIMVSEIINLYKKAGCVEDDWAVHWKYNNDDQMSIRYEKTQTSKPERKDNKDIINYGNRCSNSNKIRYPKKKRKTAWKRFYKLFPRLKPNEK